MRSRGLACLAALVLCIANGAQADQAALVIGEGLHGQGIRGLELLEDPDGKLSFEDVRRERGEARFATTQDEHPTLGFSRSVAWVRFTTDNPTDAALPWLLEFAYPHMDGMRLYEPDGAGGFTEHVAGDLRPFDEREVEYVNFVFRLQAPPGRHVYYLSAQTRGALRIPLRVWTEDSFLRKLQVELPVTWMFFGVFVAVGLYNLFLFFSVRSPVYLYYLLYSASFAAFQMILSGLAYQYLWPNAPWWHNKSVPISISVAFCAGAQFMRSFLELKQHFPKLDAFVRWCNMVLMALAVLSLVLPYHLAIRMVDAVAAVVILSGWFIAGYLVWRRHRPAYFYATAWLVLFTGITLYLLMAFKVVPVSVFTERAIEFGAALEMILLSLGLADRINVLRRTLGDKVEELNDALDRAEAARRAKSEFLANVSHELRTPLNTIINLPQAVLEDFVPAAVATCGSCESTFLLEPGEQVAEDTTCPECHAAELATNTRLNYQGRPDATAKYLNQVVHSGTHLLDVINDILDVSRLEAGRMRTERATVDLAEVLRSRIGATTTYAEQQGVTLDLHVPEGPANVLGDRTKLAQIVLNLVSNAIKFSDREGTVRVELEARDQDYCVRVQDQGIGISKRDQARIFDSFVQVESGSTRRFAGSGLGLAITRQLVELHGGRIWVESELGGGSTFSVAIPRGQAADEVDAPAALGEVAA